MSRGGVDMALEREAIKQHARELPRIERELAEARGRVEQLTAQLAVIRGDVFEVGDLGIERIGGVYRIRRQAGRDRWRVVFECSSVRLLVEHLEAQHAEQQDRLAAQSAEADAFARALGWANNAAADGARG